MYSTMSTVKVHCSDSVLAPISWKRIVHWCETNEQTIALGRVPIFISLDTIRYLSVTSHMWYIALFLIWFAFEISFHTQKCKYNTNIQQYIPMVYLLAFPLFAPKGSSVWKSCMRWMQVSNNLEAAVNPRVWFKYVLIR